MESAGKPRPRPEILVAQLQDLLVPKAQSQRTSVRPRGLDVAPLAPPHPRQARVHVTRQRLGQGLLIPPKQHFETFYCDRGGKPLAMAWANRERDELWRKPPQRSDLLQHGEQKREPGGRAAGVRPGPQRGGEGEVQIPSVSQRPNKAPDGSGVQPAEHLDKKSVRQVGQPRRHHGAAP